MRNTRHNDAPRRSAEAGETLIEILVSMIIIATAIAALLGGLATTTLASARNRDLATANAILRSYAEAVKQDARAHYSDCANSYDPATANYFRPSSWSAPTNAVVSPSCATNGWQQVDITVTTPSNSIRKLSIVVRHVDT